MARPSAQDNPSLEYVALRWMYRKAILCGLPVTEANITDSAVHPETRIVPNALSKVSPFWRDVDEADLIHYAVAQHKILDGEDCKAFPSECPIETVEFEKSHIVIPTPRTT